MKQKLKLLLLLICILTIKQTKAQGSGLGPLTPGGVFDTIFDKDGSKYLLSDLLVNYTPSPGGLGSRVSAAVTTTCNAGYFNLYFENGSLGTGSPAQQAANQNVFCQLFTDVSNFISSPLTTNGLYNKVNIWVRNVNNVYPSVPSGLLGAATQFYTMPGGSAKSGIVDGEVYKTIITGRDSYTNVAPSLYTLGSGITSMNGVYFHGLVTFNFTGSINWHTTLNTLAVGAEYDLYSVALHEVTHALGFASLINNNGFSKFGSNYNYFARYDKFLTHGGTPLITQISGTTCANYQYQFNPSLSVSVLTVAAGSCTNNVMFGGTSNQKCYCPTAFSAGSSISHFQDACHSGTFALNPGYTMHPSTTNGQNKRFLQPEERNVLCDLGYNVNSTYGTASVAQGSFGYGGSACPGIGIGGVNDGFTNSGNFIYSTLGSTTTPVTLTFPISAIIANDFNATGLSCPESILTGTASITGSNITYTAPAGFFGPVLLRYTPTNTATTGNITYIFGFILEPNCNPTNICDMVQNGDFESVTSSFQCGDGYSNNSSSLYNLKISCWYPYLNTVDLYTRGCTNSSNALSNAYNLGTNTFSTTPVFNSHNPLNNNKVLGMVSGVFSNNYNEVIQNFLGAPLINGQQYKLSFWAYNYQGTISYPNIGGGSVTYTINPTGTPQFVSFYAGTSIQVPLPINSAVSPSVGVTGLANLNITPVNAWTYVSTVFTYTGSTNGNIFNIATNKLMNDANGWTNKHYLLIDDVSLLPVNTAPTFTLPVTVYCNNTGTVTNIGQYASPSGGTFSGPGVTESGGTYNFSPIGLTAGIHQIIYTYITPSVPHCTLTAVQQVTVFPTFTITPTSQFIYAGQSATITASGSTGTYSWMPGSLTGSVVVVTPTATTVYTVTNAASGTCTANNTSTVTVSTACSQSATASYTNYTFPAGTYSASGQVLNLSGTITFTGTTTFVGYTFRMAPGALMYVNGARTAAILTLNNCKLYGCTELWQGIELENRTSTIDVKNGTTIEDMYAGIYAIETPTQTSVAGIINVENSKLNKNYVSIQLNSVTVSTLSGVAYSLTVKNSTITTESSITSPGNNLKPSTTYTYAYNQIAGGAGGSTAPYTNFPRGLAGIYLNNLSATNPVVIGDSAGSLNTYNRFSNLDFGIYATNAQLRVHNNYFFNMMGSTKRTYFDINNPVTVVGPDEIGIAIVAQHTVANTYSLQVGTKNGTASSVVAACPNANAFKMVNKGISAKNCKTVIAKGNLFDADATTDVLDVPGGGITPTADSYLYNQSQSAIWVSGLSKNAGLNYNYIKNYNAAIYAAFTMSVSSGAYLHVNSNNIQSQQATGFCTQAINIEQIGGANIGTDLLEIANNSITKVYRGIYIKSVLEGVYLHDNANITIDNVKILGKGAGANSFVHHGINMLSTQKAKVFYNTNINSITTNAFTASNYSLTNAVYVVTSPNNTITCNTTNNVGRGFYFQGGCTSNNGWLGNGISNSYRGLELKTSGVIGIQGAITGATLAANTWSNVTQETFVSGTTNANTSSIMFVQANGTYTTAPSLNFGTASQTYSVASGKGIDIRTGTSYTCPTVGGGFEMMMSGGSEFTSNDPFYTSLAKATNTLYPEYADEMLFANQQLVYKLQKQGLVTKNATNPTLQSFYNSNINSNIGKFTNVQDAVANNNSALAISKNNSINPTNAVQQKTKRVNELMLKLNINCNYQFTNTELQDLVSMANECEVKGWYVAEARSILNSVSGILIDYADNCEDTKANARMANEEEKSTIADEPLNEFVLYPNPNNGQMELVYTIHNKQAAQLIIMDVTGRLISNYELPENSSNLRIDELELKSGVYFYSIKQNNSILKQAKFVIMK